MSYYIIDLNIGDIVGDCETYEQAEQFIADDMGDHNYAIQEA